MRYKILLSIALVLFMLQGYSQTSETKTPKLIVKFCPLSLMDPLIPSANLAVEFQFNERLGLHLEGGAILNYSLLEYTDHQIRGFRFRPSIRFYNILNDPDFFLEILAVTRFAWVDAKGDFSVTSPDGNSYFRRYDYSISHQRYSLLANVGGRAWLGDGFLIDYAFGFGLSLRMEGEGNYPEGASLQRNNLPFAWGTNGLEDRYVPEITFYLNFGKVATYR
jgi:hypothetical protein